MGQLDGHHGTLVLLERAYEWAIAKENINSGTLAVNVMARLIYNLHANYMRFDNAMRKLSLQTPLPETIFKDIGVIDAEISQFLRETFEEIDNNGKIKLKKYRAGTKDKIAEFTQRLRKISENARAAPEMLGKLPLPKRKNHRRKNNNRGHNNHGNGPRRR